MKIYLTTLLIAPLLLLGSVVAVAASAPDAEDVVLAPDESVTVICAGNRLRVDRPDSLTATLTCRGTPATTTTTEPPTTTTEPPTTTTLPEGTPWPDAPEEVGLKGADGSSLPLHNTDINCPSGCVVDGVRITATIQISGQNVTIRNSLITGTLDGRGVVGLTVEDSEYDAGMMTPEGLTFRRNHVDRHVNAADLFAFAGVNNGDNHDIVIEDNYMHNNGWTDFNEHGDGIQSWGYGTHTNVRAARNYVDATNMHPNAPCSGLTGALFLSDALYAGTVEVLDNYLKADGAPLVECGQSTYYILRLDGKGTRATAHTVVTGNVVSRPTRFPFSGDGFVRCWSNDLTWADNTWEDDGSPYLSNGNAPCE